MKKLNWSFEEALVNKVTAILWLLVAIFVVLLCLLFCGCVHVKHGDFEYWRLGNQQIGEALLTLPDGSELLLESQKSELPRVTITATSIEISGKEVKP